MKQTVAQWLRKADPTWILPSLGTSVRDSGLSPLVGDSVVFFIELDVGFKKNFFPCLLNHTGDIDFHYNQICLGFVEVFFKLLHFFTVVLDKVQTQL